MLKKNFRYSEYKENISNDTKDKPLGLKLKHQRETNQPSSKNIHNIALKENIPGGTKKSFFKAYGLYIGTGICILLTIGVIALTILTGGAFLGALAIGGTLYGMNASALGLSGGMTVKSLFWINCSKKIREARKNLEEGKTEVAIISINEEKNSLTKTELKTKLISAPNPDVNCYWNSIIPMLYQFNLNKKTGDETSDKRQEELKSILFKFQNANTTKEYYDLNQDLHNAFSKAENEYKKRLKNIQEKRKEAAKSSEEKGGLLAEYTLEELKISAEEFKNKIHNDINYQENERQRAIKTNDDNESERRLEKKKGLENLKNISNEELEKKMKALRPLKSEEEELNRESSFLRNKITSNDEASIAKDLEYKKELKPIEEGYKKAVDKSKEKGGLLAEYTSEALKLPANEFKRKIQTDINHQELQKENINKDGIGYENINKNIKLLENLKETPDEELEEKMKALKPLKLKEEKWNKKRVNLLKKIKLNEPSFSKIFPMEDGRCLKTNEPIKLFESISLLLNGKHSIELEEVKTISKEDSKEITKNPISHPILIFSFQKEDWDSSKKIPNPQDKFNLLTQETKRSGVKDKNGNKTEATFQKHFKKLPPRINVRFDRLSTDPNKTDKKSNEKINVFQKIILNLKGETVRYEPEIIILHKQRGRLNLKGDHITRAQKINEQWYYVDDHRVTSLTDSKKTFCEKNAIMIQYKTVNLQKESEGSGPNNQNQRIYLTAEILVVSRKFRTFD